MKLSLFTLFYQNRPITFSPRGLVNLTQVAELVGGDAPAFLRELKFRAVVEGLQRFLPTDTTLVVELQAVDQKSSTSPATDPVRETWVHHAIVRGYLDWRGEADLLGWFEEQERQLNWTDDELYRALYEGMDSGEGGEFLRKLLEDPRAWEAFATKHPDMAQAIFDASADLVDGVES